MEQNKALLPKGPRGSWLPTLRLIRNPRAALEGWAEEFGDPFLLNALNGPVVVTGREDLIRAIHGQDPDVYSTFATQTIGPMLGNGSMLVMDGARHRRERRLAMPMFHGDRMKAYGVSIQQIALQQLEKYSSNKDLDTLQLMTDISLEVIVHCIFGGEDRAQAERLIEASRQVMRRSNPLLFFSDKMHFGLFGLSPMDRYRSARESLYGLFDSAIDRRQTSDDNRDDILSMLCRATYEDGQPITREDIRSELMTFLFAGHETTALSLTWAMYHLLSNASPRSQLKAELSALPDDAPATLSGAAYLKATIQETLRIHPIVTETLRKLKSPIELGGYSLPAGMGIAPATVLAHYNAITYPEPNQFRPERFLERSFSPFEYMPFGGGHRRCIGAAFASYEMTIVLGTLMHRYDFELLETKPVVPKRRNVTMGPSTGVRIRFMD